MTRSPDQIAARAQASAYGFTGSVDGLTKPCAGWVAVEACYSDRWATQLTEAPIRIADAGGVVIDRTARTRGLASYGLTDGDAETAPLAELGRFRQAEVRPGRVDVDLVPERAGDAEADAAMAELGAALTRFRDSSIGALQPWVRQWEARGILSVAEAQRDGVIRGLQAWWSGESDFWGGVSQLAIRKAQEAADWYGAQPLHMRLSPGLLLGSWAWDRLSDAAQSVIGGAKDLIEHLPTIMAALRNFATGIVDRIEAAVDSLCALPGEFGALFRRVKATGQDWIERMVLIASETNAFEYSFHCCMAVVMNMVPNFWAEMFGVASGYLLPEVLIELILMVIGALSAGSTAGLIAGRFAVLTAKLTRAATGARGLAVLLRVLDGFRAAIGALARIGRGLHRAISVGTREASDRIVRLRHELAQLQFRVEPATLGMNGANIRIVRKRMARFEVRPCFDVAGYARRRAPDDPPAQRRIAREYTRQLADQERGLNNLTVGEYRTARQAYNELGRDGVSDGAAQKQARRGLSNSIEQSVERSLRINNPGLTAIERRRRAVQRTQTLMIKLAALHDPDMIAGGHDRIHRVGDSGVNSSIGGAWGDYQNPDSRIARIDAAIDRAGSDPNAKLNIHLPPCRS